jgi:NitT/TauT family transport system ATP-binding protein
MLKVNQLSHSFLVKEQSFDVLKDINIEAKEGEFICILGPSGCGKTILLYLIAGFLEPTKGKITLNNKEVNKPGPDRTLVFQDYVLFPWKTVYENIFYALDNSNLTKEEKDKLVMHYLKLTDLEYFKDWYPYKLSGGMQQRVAIARALIVNPEVLLMDEPFSALDAQYRKFLRSALEKVYLETKKTIIFVTHSITEAVHLADKIYLLSARPGTVKKVYDIKLKRPRNNNDPEFLKISKEIENNLAEEFEKVINDPSMEESFVKILKLSGNRGVL